jgi:hypothetical protein
MRIGITQLIEFALLVMMGSALVFAQDVALISTVKGSVSIKSSSGQMTRASIKAKLLPGDEVSTKSDASATVLYYTGREVNLGGNKSHVVASGTKDDSFLKRLGRVFSNLLWSTESSRSMLGATRKVGKGSLVSLRGNYPCLNMIRGKVLMFEWVDLRPKLGRSYEIIISKAEGDVVKKAMVQDTTVCALSLADKEFAPGVEYSWRVHELGTQHLSDEITFRILSDSQWKELYKSLQQIDEECSRDTSAFRRVLLRSLLYVESNLMREAESSLSRLIQLKPELAVGHEMLSEVYAKVGKLDEALAQQLIADSLTENE